MVDSGHVSHSFRIGFSENESGSDGDVLRPFDEAKFDDGSLTRLEHLGSVDPFYDDCLANISDVDGRLKVLPDSVRMKQDVNVSLETEAGAWQRRARRRR